MKNSFIPLFFFSFIIASAQIKGYQNHLINPIPTIYNSNVNLRALPSLNSKILAKVDIGETLTDTYNNRKTDTINGIISYWQEIKYNGTTAYIWNDLVAKAAFKSHTNTDYKFLIKQESKSIVGVKIFFQDTFIKHQQIDIPLGEKLMEAVSIGKTYNSNDKEIIVFIFSNKKMLYYQWDNEILTPFKKEIPLNNMYYNNYIHTNANNVNIRAEPSLNSSILATVTLGKKLELIKGHYKKDTINNIAGNWHKIKYKNNEAYIWDKLSVINSSGIVISTKTKGLIFTFKNHKLIAIKNGKIIDSLPLSNYGAEDIVSLGNLGVNDVEEFLGGCVRAYSCGQSSGDIIYSWDGKKLRHFVDAIGVGDGGLSENNTVIFPSFINGTKNTINIISTDSESIDVPNFNLSGSTYEYFNRKNIKTTYTITKNLTLQKQPSKTNKIEKFIAENFNGYYLSYFKTVDFNNDGNEDVIVYATKIKYGAENKSILIILEGDHLNGYKIHSSNKKIIIHDENSPLTDVRIHKNGFSLNIYYAGYYTHPYETAILKMNYLYLDNINDFKLTQEVKITPSSTDSSWKKNTINYKKNTILFKNSWHSKLSLSSR